MAGAVLALAWLALLPWSSWSMRVKLGTRGKLNITADTDLLANITESKSIADADLVANSSEAKSSCLSRLPFGNLNRPRRNRAVESLSVFIHRDGRFQQAASTNDNLRICQSMFPGGEPFSAGGRPVCVLAQTSGGRGLQPVFWSDYNLNRSIPNFVAYRDIGVRPTIRAHRDWRSLPGLNFDRVYRPGPVSATSDSHCRSRPDSACQERISSRGHMATLSTFGWDKQAAAGTNTYVNTAPSRQPFDGTTWNDRERLTQDYARSRGEVFVLTGTSTFERDGVTQEGLDVPSMFWAAVLDPRTNEAVAWTCRNGWTRETPCACADGLTKATIEGAIGYTIWPNQSPGYLRGLV